jgi:hypothetical protein
VIFDQGEVGNYRRKLSLKNFMSFFYVENGISPSMNDGKEFE